MLGWFVLEAAKANPLHPSALVGSSLVAFSKCSKSLGVLAQVGQVLPVRNQQLGIVGISCEQLRIEAVGAGCIARFRTHLRKHPRNRRVTRLGLMQLFQKRQRFCLVLGSQNGCHLRRQCGVVRILVPAPLEAGFQLPGIVCAQSTGEPARRWRQMISSLISTRR